MKEKGISLAKVGLLLGTIFFIVLYVLFVTGLAKELKTSQILNNANAEQITRASLERQDDHMLGNFLLQPNVIKYQNKDYFIIKEGASSVTVLSLKLVFFNVFKDLLFIIVTFILFSVLVFLLARQYQRNYFNKLLEPLSEKAEQSAELLGTPVDKEDAFSSLAQLDRALERLLQNATNFKITSEKSAHLDRLTQLVNRHFFLEHISKQLDQDPPKARKSGLLFIDLDGFKQVNDSFGHSFGDEVLIQVAERLKTIVRGENLCFAEPDAPLEYNLARLGGDEFTLFIETLDDSERAVNIAKRVLKEIEKDFVLGNKIIKISASVGIAVYPDSANSPEALVQMADVAMYRAKKDGRGIYRIYSPEMGSKLRRYHYLLEEMRLGIETNSFFLSFQPIINVDGSAISYFEALIRWQHPAERNISPAEFIPIAEDSNLILKLGDWVLEEACRQMSAWYNAGMQKTRISVNISGIQLKHKSIHSWVMQTINKMGLPPHSLMLEITESCFVDISDDVIVELNKLREEGVVVAIDDFGTGFSSLSVLANLPVDVLKIDKLFVSEATKNAKYHKILHSIAELSEKLDLKVVAEGIEQVEQLELLKSLGVNYIQGYLISRPETSANVGSKVFSSQTTNILATTGTGVWPPQSSRVINQVAN